mmetsp:Transcript_9059/g.37364  ORF Transcript_9059/g.37364 Transcript_9059/m.37364 type:complete len:203 (+) Transcript_9059:151-759(+)
MRSGFASAAAAPHARSPYLASPMSPSRRQAFPQSHSASPMQSSRETFSSAASLTATKSASLLAACSRSTPASAPRAPSSLLRPLPYLRASRGPPPPSRCLSLSTRASNSTVTTPLMPHVGRGGLCLALSSRLAWRWFVACPVSRERSSASPGRSSDRSARLTGVSSSTSRAALPPVTPRATPTKPSAPTALRSMQTTPTGGR